MNYALVLYIPVIHEGYIRLFEKYRDRVTELYILGEEFIDEFSPLHKEIRALKPDLIEKSLDGLGYFPSNIVLSKANVEALSRSEIITTDEEISRRFIEKYLPRVSVTYEDVFLRWDEKNVQSDHLPSYSRETLAVDDRAFMQEARKISENAGDWWRQVGGLIVKNGEIILRAHNTHLPSDLIHYIEGDPRDFVKAGTFPEYKTAIHAEQLLISEAAKQGISLLDSSLYVTTFPCTPCAELVACSGIKKCFYETGNAYMDSERVMEAAGVEIVLVK